MNELRTDEVQEDGSDVIMLDSVCFGHVCPPSWFTGFPLIKGKYEQYGVAANNSKFERKLCTTVFL